MKLQEYKEQERIKFASLPEEGENEIDYSLSEGFKMGFTTAMLLDLPVRFIDWKEESAGLLFGELAITIGSSLSNLEIDDDTIYVYFTDSNNNIFIQFKSEKELYDYFIENILEL